MKPAAATRLRLLASTLSVLLVLAALAVAWGLWRIRASRAQLDGTAAVRGLAQAVTVTRDSLGVPTIRAANRIDASRALGWLHAQERFFQMDVLRRTAAGELSAVFGPRALNRDRSARRHGFRKLAQAVVAKLEPTPRALLDAYVAGVNAGLAALAERPFEHFVLRQDPQPWLAEDSILVIYAMTLDLQDENGDYERTLMTLRDQLDLEGLAFFAPLVTPNDAALDGTTAPVAPIPSRKLINLRAPKVGFTPTPFAAPADPFPFFVRDPETAVGSNAFALAGTHTASGAAMLANDMHLDYMVPTTWYRASLEYAGRTVTGVTLPGTPAVVAGSNGRVAWGFTNSYVDTGDLVVVELNTIAPTLYRVPDRDALVPIEQRRETFKVKGGKDVVEDFAWTVWGPIVGTNDRQRPLAHRLVVHDPDAINLNLLEMETVSTTAEAIGVAHRAGIPAQNMLIADQAGAIAWTIAGRLPKRVGFDGRLPVTWTFGDRRWDGYLASAEVPVFTTTPEAVPGAMPLPDGRLWSANQRHVGGTALAKLGDGAYRRAPRAAQIRDDLARLEKATPRDLLAVQLDDRALFLTRWHGLLKGTLAPAATGANKPRATLRALVETAPERASLDSVSYRLVRTFRDAVYQRVFPPIFASCVEAFPGFNFHELQLEPALWAMLESKPLHLLAPEYATWDDLLIAAADDVIKAVEKSGDSLGEATWGRVNVTRIRHPFTYSYPWLARWLNMPADPLPGDADTPRVQRPGHGSSERLVVSPGRESEGIFHMPGGQSAHPMSPFHRAGHDAWVRGEPTPFLPGATQHTLTLTP
ncbi:penicillin acylase family protein [Horticoccus sp. 23ND18S-11]|uniref:penicillin acylase family protein n=1 Tax=Horticoccus sp. 23ND18S-11 TaxID=3391832 RepID=UPI0039C9B93A